MNIELSNNELKSMINALKECISIDWVCLGVLEEREQWNTTLSRILSQKSILAKLKKEIKEEGYLSVFSNDFNETEEVNPIQYFTCASELKHTREENLFSQGWKDFFENRYNPPYTPDRLFRRYQHGWSNAEAGDRCDYISEFKFRATPSFNNT